MKAAAADIVPVKITDDGMFCMKRMGDWKLQERLACT
jgi:hypothetical protein